MRVLEAKWIRSAIVRRGAAGVSPLLNLGSSTAEFREVRKPHIHHSLFLPLQADGFDVAHADMKSAAGVDIVGNILDPAFIRDLKGRGFRSVLLSNLLEHVDDPAKVAAVCEDIVGRGGFIFCTSPYRYPYHADPIDTMFRPMPEEMAAIFKRSKLVESTLLADGGPIGDIAAGGWRQIVLFPIKLIWRLGGFPFRRAVARTEWNRLKWFGRSYTITCAVLQVVR